MDKTKMLLLLLSTMLACCDSHKVLVLFPMPIKSQGILGNAVVRHLLNAGHEVTYLTPFPSKDPPDNLRVIDVSDNFNRYPAPNNITEIIGGKFVTKSYDQRIYLTTEIIIATTENKNVRQLLENPKEQFDVVVAEWMFTDLPAGYAAIFDCPFIWVSPLGVNPLVTNLLDDGRCTTFSVDYRARYIPPLSGFEYVKELWTQTKIWFMKFMHLDDFQAKVYNDLMAPIIVQRERKAPYFNDVRFNISMVLGNSFIPMDQANPLPQAYKLVGGFHVEENVKPLPPNVQKIMNSSKDGVIYFSMGSKLESKDFPKEIKTSLLKMFETLNQTVIWKLEEDLPDTPPNVHIMEWAPQQGILAHPNCTLFITQGGLLSVTEAIHFAKPIIGIPVGGNQFTNVINAENIGFGKRVDLSYDLADELKKAILEVISDPRYTEKAKKISSIYHDRLVKPGAELVHWVEHAVRTRGAPHLRSPAFDSFFHPKSYTDIYILFLTTPALLFFINARINRAFKTYLKKTE